MKRCNNSLSPDNVRSLIQCWATMAIPLMYRQTSNISRALVGNKILVHSDVIGASPVGAAPTTPSFSTSHMASMNWAQWTTRQTEKHFSFGIWCGLYLRFGGICTGYQLGHPYGNSYPGISAAIKIYYSQCLTWMVKNLYQVGTIF